MKYPTFSSTKIKRFNTNRIILQGELKEIFSKVKIESVR